MPPVYLRYKPVHSNSLWCADGSGTIGYKYIDKDGDLRSMRLYVMLVSDVATGKIVGWCPSGPGLSQRVALHDETGDADGLAGM